MNVPDRQRVAIYQNKRPIGLIETKLGNPDMLGGEIITMSWHGTCLGEAIDAGSVKEAYYKARSIALKRGLRQIWLADGGDVTALYEPAQEE